MIDLKTAENIAIQYCTKYLNCRRLKNTSNNRFFFQVPVGLSKPKINATICGHQTPEKSVNYFAPVNKVFIQTDKPIYKPGQKGLYSTHYQS